MRKIHYAAQDFNVPEQDGFFITLMAYTHDGRSDARTYWITGLDEAANKVDNYTRYIIKAMPGVCVIMARVTNDDRGYRPYGLVATYESDRRPDPWRLAVYNSKDQFLKWEGYKSLLKDIA